MVYYDCDTCGKEFKQKIDYERHKNRKNKCQPNLIDVQESKSNPSSNPPEIWSNPPKTPPKTPEISNNISKDANGLYNCNSCNKRFTRSDNYNRHILFRCKFIDEPKNNDDKVIELLLKMDEKHTNEIQELKNTIKELKEQNASIIAESTTSASSLVGQVINSNNKVNNNTVNNNTVNNNIILKFDDLNAYKRLDKKDIQYIMDAHEEVLIQRSVEVTHCNSKYPELNNVYIPDKKMRHGVAYTGEKFETIAIDKLITELIVSQQNNVCDYLDMKDIIIREDKRAKKDDIAENLLRYKDSRSEYKRDLYENVVK